MDTRKTKPRKRQRRIY